MWHINEVERKDLQADVVYKSRRGRNCGLSGVKREV
jgi:hypothetical protein